MRLWSPTRLNVAYINLNLHSSLQNAYEGDDENAEEEDEENVEEEEELKEQSNATPHFHRQARGHWPTIFTSVHLVFDTPSNFPWSNMANSKSIS